MVTQKTRSQGFAHYLLLAGIAVVVAGGGFAAVSGDIAYSAQSALAAVTSSLTTTPAVVISRNTTLSPTKAIWPGGPERLAVFNVVPRSLKAPVKLNNVRVTVATDGISALLKTASPFYLQYVSCSSTGSDCQYTVVPITSVNKSSNSMIIDARNVNLSVVPGQTHRLEVQGPAYYAVSYFNATGATGSVRATVTGGTTAVNTTTGATVPVEVSLAYGAWIKVLRGTGYGYGYYDYTRGDGPSYLSSNKLDYIDISYLSQVISGVKQCPYFKVCNLNNDGYVNATDKNILTQYAGANAQAPFVVKMVSSEVRKEGRIDLEPADIGFFTIKFTVTASTGDVYLDMPRYAISSNSQEVSGAGTAVFTASNSDSLDKTGIYVVKKGATRSFNLTVSYIPTSTGFSKMHITSIPFGSTYSLGSFYTYGLEALKTDYLSLTTR